MRTVSRCGALAAALVGSSIFPAAAADLGKNLSGETCMSAAAASPDAALPVFCAGRTTPDGEVLLIYPDRKLSPGAAASRNAIVQMLSAQNSDRQLDCGAPGWSGAAVLQLCALKSSGWPRVVVGVESGGTVYRAEGPPSLVPVLAAAINWLAPGRLSTGDEAALQKAVQAKYADAVLHASPGDYASFGKFIDDARLAAAHNDFAASEADYRRALDVEEKLFGPDSIASGETLAELGLQVSNQGRFAEAASLFRRARPIIEASANEGARARLDSYQALDAANRKSYAEALAFATNATAAREKEFEQSGGTDSPSEGRDLQPGAVSRGELSHSLRIEAEMALRLGDFARARASAEEALWIVTEEPGLPLWWRPDTVALMGEVNEAQGRVVQAEHDFRDARDLDQRLFGDTAPTALADFTLGEFYTRQQVYPAALDAFRAGYAIAQKDSTTRAEIQPDVTVQFMAANAGMGAGDSKRDQDIFRASQYQQGGTAEQAIARIAAREAAADAGLADLVGRAQSAEHERDQARVTLAAEYAKSDEERNAAREGELTANVRLASDTADGLLAKVRATFPRYSGIADPPPAELADVQAKLRPDEALLVYVIGANTSYALVVKAKSFDAVGLPVSAAALSADIADLRTALTPSLGRTRNFSLKNSHDLYAGLVAPLGERLDGVDHLLVVPGATLSNLPFALLSASAPAGKNGEHDYVNADWLVRHVAISEVPSPRAFVTLRSASPGKTARQPFLGLAPEFHGTATGSSQSLAQLADSCREGGAVSTNLVDALPRLPGSTQEVESIAGYFGRGNSTVLVGAEATEANLRAQPLNRYRVIYFATHGLLPGELRCASEPALVLSPPAGAATPENDGVLNASDVARLALDADLVVLSGCDTAVEANAPGGEALGALSTAFFVAGARAVLASHWEVSSASTAALMTGLFARASQGEGTAEALRQAQLALIAKPSTAHPFYWAAFTLMGDGGPLAGKAVMVSEKAAEGKPL